MTAPPSTPLTDSPGIPAERLVLQCEQLADRDCRGYSPLYERLARGIAADDELVERLRVLPDAKRLPVNLLAAVHWLVRRRPDSELAAMYRGAPGDPFPPFRRLVLDRYDDIAELLRTRTIQTNEVGRCSALVPALTSVASVWPGRPLALVEIGPSAGLNLFLDRYAIAYDDGRTTGPTDSAVHLGCAVVTGSASPPLPEDRLDIVSRQGIDLAPVDICDDDACAWLEACIWPDVPGRLERFRAAATIARRDPPRLHRGDALDLVGEVVDALPQDVLPVVVSTWALAYLDAVGRARVHDLLARCGGHRDLAFVTAEWPHVTPWLPEPPRPPAEPDKGATLVAMTSWHEDRERVRPLAWMHAHGQWIDWFASSEDAS